VLNHYRSVQPGNNTQEREMENQIEIEAELWEDLFSDAAELEKLAIMHQEDQGNALLHYNGIKTKLMEYGYTEEKIDGYAEIYAVNFV
jgi:hypothetical protein